MHRVDVGRMTLRFASNLLALLVGSLLMADRFVFGPGSLTWVAFGGACLILATTLLAFLERGRGALQRTIDLALVPVSGWLVLASLVYAVATAGWMALACGGACALLGVAGLVAHEAITERAISHAQRRPAGVPAERDGDAGATGGPAPLALRAWPS